MGYLIRFPYRVKFPARNKKSRGYTVGQTVTVEPRNGPVFKAVFIGVDKQLDKPRAIVRGIEYDYVLPFERIRKCLLY